MSDENAIFLVAFNDLSSCRNFSDGGAGPIPVDKLWAWCDRYCTDSDQEDVVIRVIGEMDNVYMKHQSKEAKRKTQKKPIGRGVSRRPSVKGHRRR